MRSFFKNLFSKEKINLADLASKGAIIVDVRSAGEYKHGHIEGSLNIPLGELMGSLEMLKKRQPVILCCASGMRSSEAASQLKSKGLTHVYNGGSWQKVNIQLNRPSGEE